MADSLEKIQKIYLLLKESLEKQLIQLKKWKNHLEITSDQNKFLLSLQQSKYSEITGDLLYQIKTHRQANFDHNHTLNNHQFHNFWQRQKGQLINIFQQFQKLSQQHDFVEFKPYSICKIDSMILQNQQQKRILLSFFDREKVNFRLLYRASLEDFSTTKFHQKCDKISNTMVLIKTEFNKILGGFTPLIWRSLKYTQFVKDNQQQSFMFSISLAEKYPLLKPDKAIMNDSFYGPIFGVGYDICIRDRANQTTQNAFYFPTSYGNGKHQKNQKTWQALVGSKDGYMVRISQWQVFVVQ